MATVHLLASADRRVVPCALVSSQAQKPVPGLLTWHSAYTSFQHGVRLFPWLFISASAAAE